MTNEEISKWLMNLKDDIGKTQYQPLWHYAEALDMAIEALQQPEQCEDTISRQAAIDATWFEPSYTDPLNVLTEVRDRLEALPSAQTKIIRCKDCKYWDGKKNGGFCEVWDEYISNDAFFCGSAERRVEDE